jgi:hypothetical protein
MGYTDKDRQREYCRVWVKKRRDRFFSGKSCSVCGSSEDLVIHHENPGEKINHRIWSWTDTRRSAEIAKCVILCKKCHIEHHAQEKRKYIHGTITMYQKHKCRCELCREANRKRGRT